MPDITGAPRPVRRGFHAVHSALHQLVRRTLARHQLVPAGSRLLVGVSGGSDSVGLLLLLRDLEASCGFQVTGVGHFNHRARATADRDEQFSRNLAEAIAVPFYRDDADVKGVAASAGQSFEDAARRLRYAFLRQAAQDADAHLVAVGHTRDDQAETFLLKLARGAGSTGLGSVYPRRDNVVRPLLDASRHEIRDWLKARGQDWVEDESNADLSNPRNRVRHRVLPALDAAYGGPTRAQLARAAELVGEDGRWLDELATERLGQLGVHSAEGLAFDALMLLGEAPPLRRRVLLLAMRGAAGAREVGLEHVEAALEVLRGERGRADVPGSRWELRRKSLVLVRQGPAAK